MSATETTYSITKQITPLPAPGTRTSRLNRAFNAALGAFLADDNGVRYEHLYRRYMGIAPRFSPRAADCDPWPAAGDTDAALDGVLGSGALRFGYVAGAPYVYLLEDNLTGFDYELGIAVAENIALHYLGDARGLRAEFVPVVLAGGDDQADKLAALHRGLVDGDFDIALSGQMILPDQYLGGLALEWTAPTALLFTAISYTGRDRDKLDQRALALLHSTDLKSFTAYAVGESRRLALELRVFSVVNPGPSPGAAQGLTTSVNRGGGRAVWVPGDVAGSDRVMLEALDHFAVGDSLASGAQSQLLGFDGVYLNIPATDELWPIAGFTAKDAGTTGRPEFAVYAEHSDAKKPMALHESADEKQRGWNLRVWNRTEVERGRSIRRDDESGVVRLRPGLYHITASSMVTWDDITVTGPGRVPSPSGTWAGYCRLRRAADADCPNQEAICVGTISTANMVPSLIDTYFEVKPEEGEAAIVLEHQVGNNVSHLYLQGIWEQSSWHVFARIAIHKV